MTNVKTMNKDTKYFLCFFDKEFFRTDVNKKIKHLRNFVWNIIRKYKDYKSLIKKIKQIF